MVEFQQRESDPLANAAAYTDILSAILSMAVEVL